jgi:hypothetical protein
MSLSPDDRIILAAALRPPDGCRVEVAVGTTYSLNLNALLLAPLSFALSDSTDPDDLAVSDPVRLLDAALGYLDVTTVFCEAGGIHVPAKYRSILALAEDGTLEVAQPDGNIFHPKIWALRFVAEDGTKRHRLIVLSRNLTLDTSWDTALVLDEDTAGVIDAAPAADFIRRLPDLAIRGTPAERREQINSLANGLGRVRFAAPPPFTGGELLPMGLPTGPVWPFPDRARRVLAISPFLTPPAIQSLGRVSGDKVLVSRAESLDMIGRKQLRGWQSMVLQPQADNADGPDEEETVSARFETRSGLHAKTYILDLPGSVSQVVTGSANLTSEVWGSGVEFSVSLTGPTRECGVKAVLGSDRNAPGLGNLLEPYEPDSDEAVDDELRASRDSLDRFHRQLALALPQLHCDMIDDDRVRVRLNMTVPDDAPGTTTIWLASLSGDAQRQPLADGAEWIIAPTNLTPFIAFETIIGSGEQRVVARCVIKTDLVGEIPDRRRDAIFSIVRSKADVLRYLAFLLGDSTLDLAQLSENAPGNETSPTEAATSAMSFQLALLEPLVRAAGRDEHTLARVAAVVAELREHPDGVDLIPEGFDELWDVVWQVHQEVIR